MNTSSNLLALGLHASESSFHPFLFRISNPCSERFYNSVNELGHTAWRRRYKIRTKRGRLSCKLLIPRDGSPAWIRTTNLTIF
jgi:hypothetical protein